MIRSDTGLYCLFAITIFLFIYIGKSIDASWTYYVSIIMYVLIGWFCMEHFDKFVTALADFQNSFNQWVKEIFKIEENVAENGKNGEETEK